MSEGEKLKFSRVKFSNDSISEKYIYNNTALNTPLGSAKGTCRSFSIAIPISSSHSICPSSFCESPGRFWTSKTNNNSTSMSRENSQSNLLPFIRGISETNIFSKNGSKARGDGSEEMGCNRDVSLIQARADEKRVAMKKAESIRELVRWVIVNSTCLSFLSSIAY